MPAISPFRALRYDEAVAGPLADLVAPPYDVHRRRPALRRSGTRATDNIVHLTLPDSPEAAAARRSPTGARAAFCARRSRRSGGSRRSSSGPDGSTRTREGIAGSIEATPYSEGKVLPHERTHAKAEGGPAGPPPRDPDAARADLPALRRRPAGRACPTGEPEMRGRRGRRAHARSGGSTRGELELDVPLLIADGHHRYETAVAFREEEPSATHTFAVLVSSRSPGLEIFPTHRVVSSVGVDPDGFMTSTWDTGSLAVYREGNFFRLESDDELDTQRGRALRAGGRRVHAARPGGGRGGRRTGWRELAFLVRAPSVAQVFEYAGRGETMPPKSTFFYPKLTSGLLLHPV